MTKKGGGPLREGSVKLTPVKSTPISADHRAKVINMPRSMATTTRTCDGNYKSPSRRAIKKAHVRFDDYLDLNEENMRRSCKRLMNRLYHASPDSDSQPSVANVACSMSVATKSTCRPISPPPLLAQVDDKNEQITSQPAITMSPGVAHQDRAIADNITSGHVIASSMVSEPSQTNEKSYLRSQYERRQKRQIELMHQQQQNHGQTMVTEVNLTAADARSCNQNDNNEVTSVDGPGANNNICRQHQRRLQREQQDLVAKSHELSKRRFFEKLERRESMKNSTQSSTRDERQPQLSSGARAFKQVQHPQPPPPPPPSSDHRQKEQQMLPTKANIGKENLSSGEDEKSKIFREPVKHRELIARGGGGMGNKSCAADAQTDEQLMLKVYQSMVAAGASQSPAQYCGDMTAARAVCTNAQLNLPSRTNGGPPLKLPPASTQPSLYGCVESDLLATELIGLHTSTPQQQVPDGAAATAGKSLIESQRTNPGVSCPAAGDDEHSLIEFSKGQQRHPLDTSERSCSSTGSEPTNFSCSKTMHRQCESEFDGSSAFEIKVPADLSSSLNQVDSASCFIDRLLVVKHLSSDDDHAKSGPASLVSRCSNEMGSEIDQSRATSRSTTQLEGNKASINLMEAAAAVSSSSSTDNEINNGEQQIKESAAQVSSSLPDGLATIEEEATGTGDGVGDVHKVTGDPASEVETADAGTDADEAAASLETIITNKRETRDVPPEANAVAGLLMLQQTDNAHCSTEPTPLNHCDMQDNKQHKVSKCDDSSIEVDREMEEDERTQSVGQVVAPKLKEIAEVDQESSIEGHQPTAVEDEHEQREQALSVVMAVAAAAAAGSKEQDQYANPCPDQPAVAAASSQGNHVHCLGKNNVNHDPSATEEASLHSSQEHAGIQPPSHCENIVGINLISDGRGGNFMSNHQHHSIEPSDSVKSPISALEHGNIARPQRLVSSSSSIDPTAEEDIGSSCSSSGFGASVSATSSASSADDRRSHHHRSFKEEKQPIFGAHGAHYRRPISVPQNSLYDSLRAASRKCDETLRNSSVLAQQSDQLHYKQVVGPDQAYPSDRVERPILVENYGYASLTGRYRVSAPLPELPPRTDACHATAAAKTKQPPELDLYSTVLYANLPAFIRMQRSPIVEYATVKTASRNGGTANIPPAENKRYSRVADRHHHHLGQSNSSETPSAQRPDDCDSSLSGSANSGGFSMLPPVRLIDHNFANNSDFSKSLEPCSSIYGESTTTSQQHQHEPHKKSASLFKRFGSLVSRAFTSTSASVGGNDYWSSGHFSTESTMAPHSQSNASQSLSLHVNAQKCAPPPPRMHEHVSAITIARREHKSGGSAKDSSNRNHKDTLYTAATRANVVHHTTATTRAAEKTDNKTPLAMAEADLVILPTKHSKDNQQQRKNDTYGGAGATLRHSHRNITVAAELPRDCNRAKKDENSVARAKRDSRDVSERRHCRRMLGLSARSTSISIASSYSSSSLDCSSTSERYGPTSLIDQSHANSDMRLNDCPRGRARPRHYARLGGGCEIGSAHDATRGGESSSMLFASLQQARSLQITNEPRPYGGSWRKLATDEGTSSENEAGGASAERSNELVVTEGKCRSLNLYQNLLRNYVKRRHHRHHHHNHGRGHHHHHHHGHSHHHKYSSSARHAHCSSATRCGQQCLAVSGGRVCSSLSEQSSNNVNQRSISGGAAAHKKTTHGDKASVWGQLIKINKSDGSQVIELQRAPSRSWGFFVARGAINNMKGIFISRVHDNATGSSLTGLLGIGDRILSIDNCAIEPDDIMRVNQMISKKNKILMRVKPFKG